MIIQTSFEKSTQPLKSFGITFLFCHAAHKYLYGPCSLIPLVSSLNTKRLSKLVFWNSPRFVNFIPQYHDWHLLQLRNLQNTLQFYAALLKSLCVRRINQVNDSIDVRNIIPPSFSSSFVASQIPSFERNFSHGQLL